MILLRILDHDLHRARSTQVGAIPLWIEIPAKPGFLPAVVSLSTPKFGVSRKLTEGKIRTGVFAYDSDRVDEIIGPMFEAAYDLSVEEKWKNIFSTPAAAFDYVQNLSGTTAQPHICLVPQDWDEAKLKKWAGKDLKVMPTAQGKKDEGTVVHVYKKVCRIQPCAVTVPVFCSKPDFVGMYTQIVGGRTSILLHNIKNGLGFVSDRKVPRVGSSRTS